MNFSHAQTNLSVFIFIAQKTEYGKSSIYGFCFGRREEDIKGTLAHVPLGETFRQAYQSFSQENHKVRKVKHSYFM